MWNWSRTSRVEAANQPRQPSQLSQCSKRSAPRREASNRLRHGVHKIDLFRSSLMVTGGGHLTARNACENYHGRRTRNLLRANACADDGNLTPNTFFVPRGTRDNRRRELTSALRARLPASSRSSSPATTSNPPAQARSASARSLSAPHLPA